MHPAVTSTPIGGGGGVRGENVGMVTLRDEEMEREEERRKREPQLEAKVGLREVYIFVNVD